MGVVRRLRFERPGFFEKPGLLGLRFEKPGFLGLVFLLLIVLFPAACAPTQQLGPRPGQTPLDAAEIYLQRYQPGLTPRVFQTTRIYDRNGELIGELWSEGKRSWLPLKRFSPYLIHATIAAEDSTFYSNTGVDTARVIGAALTNWEAKQVVSGASTITMQLARNLFLGPDERYEQSMDRKMLEAGLAQELTQLFSKDEILEMYLNLANYGHLSYGPEAASQTYFGKPASQLTLAQAAMLAGIPQSPATLDPFRNLQAAKARQRIVLDLMVRHEYLTPAWADAAYAEPITLNPDPDRRVALVPHFVNYVSDVLDARLGGSAGVRSGLIITSTLDLRFQTLAQDIVAKQVKALKPKHDLSNAALVAMLPYSGEIVAMVGSADFSDTKIAGQVNVARSLRQPGSSIKPVLYAAAMDDLLISPATVLWDIPVSYPITGTKPYTPRNYDGKFHGPVTVRTALANSYNIPAVKLLDAVGVDRMLRGAELMGVRSLSDSGRAFGLALTLGGGDVTLLELTTAYNVLASEGQAVAPEPILQAADGYGRPVLNARRPSGEPLQAVKPSTAFLLTDILSDNAARTPMFGANSPLKLSKPAAAKTGTTDDWRDNWTVGYMRYLVAGIWTGNSDGRPMRNVSGIAGAAPIWHDFMEAVLKQPALLATIGAPAPLGAPAAETASGKATPLPDASSDSDWQFVRPSDVELRDACPPKVTCRKGGEYFSTEWLNAAGDAGPLADSVALVQSAPVYAGGQWAAYCRTEPGAVRALLKLPGPLGVPVPTEEATITLSAAPQRLLQPVSNSPRQASVAANASKAPRQVDVLSAVAWALRSPLPVDLGPCSTLQATARQALGGGGLAVSADLSAAMDTRAGPVDGTLPTAVDWTLATPSQEDSLPAAAASPSGFRFALAQGIVHHGGCPGQYIMGSVITSHGAPMPNVHIEMVDEWGNRADAWSKSGANDAGLYDFPIGNTPNRYTLTVVDDNGTAISAPVTVEHHKGYAGDHNCHTVIWQAY